MPRVELPWDYSDVPPPGEGVPNLPSREGRELGRLVAQMTEAARPKCERLFPGTPPMCQDCAFRAGTAPNGTVSTLMDAIKCVVEGTPFYCHHGVVDGDPKRLCGGYAVASVSVLLPEVARKMLGRKGRAT